MKNLNFLVSINAIYAYYDASPIFNLHYNVLIFNNINCEQFIIRATTVKSNEGETTINDYEFVLTNIGPMEYRFLLNLFEDDRNMFKNFMFNKFLDCMEEELDFELIY